MAPFSILKNLTKHDIKPNKTQHLNLTKPNIQPCVKKGVFMTKKEARQLYYLNKEVELWQKALAAERSKSLIQGRQLANISSGNKGFTDEVAHRAMRELEIENKIKELEHRTAEEKLKILKYIESLDNSIDRQIVWYRAACCHTWRYIAQEVGGYNSEDSVRQRYNRLFEKE